jgi:hypothetical protein
MNSWRSTELSAWAPPLMMFIIGTGSVTAPAPLGGSRGAGGGHGDGQDGVGAEASFIARAVEVEHDAVDLALRAGVLAGERRRDLVVDVVGRVQRALAEVAGFVAVPQLDCFVLAGGGAGGHGRPAQAAVGEDDIRFHRRVASRIEDLSADYLYYRRQRLCS